jgi:hypothetical protein
MAEEPEVCLGKSERMSRHMAKPKRNSQVPVEMAGGSAKHAYHVHQSREVRFSTTPHLLTNVNFV